MTNLVKTIMPALAALLSALFVQWFVFRKLRREIADRYTSMYLQSQLSAYQELWVLLGPTTRYQSPAAILCECSEGMEFNVDNAKIFCEQLTSFFFSKHGLFLRARTRAALFTTRARLAIHIKRAAQSSRRIVLTTTRKAKLRQTLNYLQETVRIDARVTDQGFALTRKHTLE
jgi:hypothetical protein